MGEMTKRKHEKIAFLKVRRQLQTIRSCFWVPLGLIWRNKLFWKRRETNQVLKRCKCLVCFFETNILTTYFFISFFSNYLMNFIYIIQTKNWILLFKRLQLIANTIKWRYYFFFYIDLVIINLMNSIYL